MRKLELDFARRPAWVSPLGLCLLLAGLLASGYGSWRLQAAQATRDALSGRLWQQQVPAAPVDSSDADALRAADRLAVQFRRPWPALFARLERIPADGVTLDQLLPQAGDQGSVQLGGQAKDAAALFAYLRQLREIGGLRDVHLLQQKREEKSDSLRFTAQAHWLAGSAPAVAP